MLGLFFINSVQLEFVSFKETVCWKFYFPQALPAFESTISRRRGPARRSGVQLENMSFKETLF